MAIRAVDLLCENNQDTTKHQAGGALLALVSLGELELAVSLLATLWPEQLVSSQVAEVILRKVLLAGSDDIKNDAAVVLADNAEQIQVQGSIYWPIPNLGWSADLPADCRLSLVFAACEWFTLALEKDPNDLPYAALVLYQALADPTVANFAAACLRPLGVFLPESAASTGSRGVSVREIIGSLEAYPDEPESIQAQAYQERVEAALAGREEETPQTDPGSAN